MIYPFQIADWRVESKENQSLLEDAVSVRVRKSFTTRYSYSQTQFEEFDIIKPLSSDLILKRRPGSSKLTGRINTNEAVYNRVLYYHGIDQPFD